MRRAIGDAVAIFSLECDAKRRAPRAFAGCLLEFCVTGLVVECGNIVVVVGLLVGCVMTVVGRGVRMGRGARNDGGCCVVVDVERSLLMRAEVGLSTSAGGTPAAAILFGCNSSALACCVDNNDNNNNASNGSNTIECKVNDFICKKGKRKKRG